MNGGVWWFMDGFLAIHGTWRYGASGPWSAWRPAPWPRAVDSSSRRGGQSVYLRQTTKSSFGAVDEAVDEGDDAGGGGEHVGPFGEGFVGGEHGQLEVAAGDELEEEVGVAELAQRERRLASRLLERVRPPGRDLRLPRQRDPGAPRGGVRRNRPPAHHGAAGLLSGVHRVTVQGTDRQNFVRRRDRHDEGHSSHLAGKQWRDRRDRVLPTELTSINSMTFVRQIVFRRFGHSTAANRSNTPLTPTANAIFPTKCAS